MKRWCWVIVLVGCAACSGAAPLTGASLATDGGALDARSGGDDARAPEVDAGREASAGDGASGDAEPSYAGDGGVEADPPPKAMQCQNCYMLGSKSQNCLIAENDCCQQVCNRTPAGVALCPAPPDPGANPCIFDYADGGGGCVAAGSRVVTLSNNPSDPGYCDYPLDNDAGYAVCQCD